MLKEIRVKEKVTKNVTFINPLLLVSFLPEMVIRVTTFKQEEWEEEEVTERVEKKYKCTKMNRSMFSDTYSYT